MRDSNRYIEENKPWELKKTDNVRFLAVMGNLVSNVSQLGVLLCPFLPSTSEKIETALKTGKVEPLFQRIK